MPLSYLLDDEQLVDGADGDHCDALLLTQHGRGGKEHRQQQEAPVGSHASPSSPTHLLRRGAGICHQRAQEEERGKCFSPTHHARHLQKEETYLD